MSQDRSPHLWDDPFIPREVRAQDDALRPAMQALSLIDTSVPAWPVIAGILREFVSAGVTIDGTAAEIAMKVGTHRWESSGVAETFSQPALAIAAGAIVYYIRRGDLIKIGTTNSPHDRFHDLVPDEILAFEPGARQQESARHNQFRHLHVRGEHFRDAPELREHIGNVRSLYGPPDPTWPTSGIPRTLRGPRIPPPAKSTETMTVPEAVAEFGLNKDTFHGWVHRGVLLPVGQDHRRRNLYYREQVIWLCSTMRRRHAPTAQKAS